MPPVRGVVSGAVKRRCVNIRRSPMGFSDSPKILFAERAGQYDGIGGVGGYFP